MEFTLPSPSWPTADILDKVSGEASKIAAEMGRHPGRYRDPRWSGAVDAARSITTVDIAKLQACASLANGAH